MTKNTISSSLLETPLTKQVDSISEQSSRAKLKAHEKSLLRELREAHLSDKKKLAAYKCRLYLSSYAPRFVAMEAAYKSLKPCHRPPKSLQAEFAQELNPYLGTDEEVKVYWKPKRSNPYDFRPIMNFGITNRALQNLVAKCLKAQADLHPMQFAINCGRQAAVQRTIDLMRSGYKYVIEADIANCYPSFNGEKIAGVLPLPKEVTEQVVLSTHLNLYPANPQLGQLWDSEEELLLFFGEGLTEARQGIAQGSATSSVVSEMLLSSVLAELPTCGEALTYADNILLLAKNPLDVVTMIKALGCVLQAHPAGPLQLKEPKVYEPGQPVDFLGYRLSVGKTKDIIEPTTKNLHKFKVKFEQGIKKISGNHASKEVQVKAVKKLKNYVTGWTNAFSLWPEAKQYRDVHIAKIEMKALLD